MTPVYLYFGTGEAKVLPLSENLKALMNEVFGEDKMSLIKDGRTGQYFVYPNVSKIKSDKERQDITAALILTYENYLRFIYGRAKEYIANNEFNNLYKLMIELDYVPILMLPSNTDKVVYSKGDFEIFATVRDYIKRHGKRYYSRKPTAIVAPNETVALSYYAFNYADLFITAKDAADLLGVEKSDILSNGKLNVSNMAKLLNKIIMEVTR